MIRFVFLLALLLSSCNSYAPYIMPLPPVFPVVRVVEATGDVQVKGTAFRFDEKRQLYLTAAHVLEDLHLESTEDPVLIGRDGEHRLVPVVWGYDFTDKQASRKSTTSDWVVLRLESAAEVLPDGEISVGIVLFWDPRNVSPTAWGFPRGTDELAPVSETFSPRPGADQLLLAEGRVDGGFSGAPSVIGETLFGIVLRKDAHLPTTHHRVLPTQYLVRTIAEALPRSSTSDAAIAVLRSEQGLSEENLERLKGHLDKFSALDHWQFQRWACRHRQFEPAVSVFLLRYYRENSVWGFWDELLECLVSPDRQ